jgi:hypothetical protein
MWKLMSKHISWNWWAFICWCFAMAGFVLIRLGWPFVGKVFLFLGIFAGGYSVFRSMHQYFSERRNGD